MSSDLMLGRKIKGYQIDEVLGRGGMGCVYRAQHPLIGKQVAIKVLQGVQSPSAVSRFILEAKAVNDIRHDNLIDILDFDELEEGNPYIIMEYLEGRSLDDAIQAETFSPAQVGHIGLQLCSALCAAHQKGIIHRDLKGDNIFLINRANQENFVKVLDFGIAKLLDVTGDRRHRTEANSLLGTPLYMAPEQITGKAVDARTDLYALGILLYQMATGRPPFDDPAPMVLLAMQVTSPPPPPRLFAPQISSALEGVILRCLEKAPDDRYASMSELAVALGEACGVDAALYMGAKLMSQRLLSESTMIKVPEAFLDSPTELGCTTEEDLKATMPALPMVDESLLFASMNRPVPSATPQVTWESDPLDDFEHEADTSQLDDSRLSGPLDDARPTTEMTREEILSITRQRPATKKPRYASVILLLLSMFLAGLGVGAWFIFLRV